MSSAEIHAIERWSDFMKSRGIVLVLAAACTAVACSDGAVDIGDDRDSTTRGEKLSDYDGAWNGYSEAYVFDLAGDSDRMRLAIDAAGNATLQVGEGAATTPAIDPDVAPFGPWSVGTADLARLTAGFRYPLHDLRVEDRRLRFVIDPTDVLRDWCQAQTPIFDPAYATYGCRLGRSFSTYDDGTCTVFDLASPNNEVEMDCGKAFLCSAGESLCACDATSCDAHAWPELLTEVDLALSADGDEMSGTLLTSLNYVPQRISLRFSR